MSQTNYFIKGDGDDSEVNHHRRRRTVTVSSDMRSPAFDANGNRILKITRREAGGADVADVETAERVIQVRTIKYYIQCISMNNSIISFELSLIPNSNFLGNCTQ